MGSSKLHVDGVLVIVPVVMVMPDPHRYGIYMGDLLDRDAIAFAFLILALMIKPRGLFASK